MEPLDSDSNKYVLYKSELPHFDNYFCPEFSYSLNDSFHLHANVQPQLKKQSMQNDNEFAYVELFLIASKSTCDALFGDRDDIEDYLKTVSNVVDGYYQEMNVHVVLVHIELWLERDYFQTGSTSTETINSFSDHRTNQIRQFPDSYWSTADAIHVIHNLQLDASKNSRVVGIANLNVICTSFASGISSYKTNPALTAITLTHELGHNFGLVHVNDGNLEWNCPCETGHCIMSANTNFGLRQVWSECSLNFVRNHFAYDWYSCLHNIPEPSSLVFGSGCGNTIVEAGEQCDCGFKGNCKSKCCSPETCQLVLKAACDIGLCCENCQLLAEGVICREKSDECDLPDVCSGTSPYCPQNIHKEDGTSCLKGQAYCFEGACVSRDLLCKKIYGPLSSASDHCYEVNAYGKQGGNCGLDVKSKTGYKACAIDDVFCGKLLCFGSRELMRPTDFTVLSWLDTDCYTLDVASNEPSQAIGLVPDGTACGAKMSCQNHQCRSIATSICNPPCIGGVCDNLGYCRCENGKVCGHSPTGIVPFSFGYFGCKNGELCDHLTTGLASTGIVWSQSVIGKKTFVIFFLVILNVVIGFLIVLVRLWCGKKSSATNLYSYALIDNDHFKKIDIKSGGRKLRAANLRYIIDKDDLIQKGSETRNFNGEKYFKIIISQLYKYFQ